MKLGILGVVALLRAYFDDSGTHAGSAVVVLGGLIGTDSEWESFDAAWRAQLAVPLPDKPRLKKFHLSSCVAAEDEFRHYKPVEREAVVGAFRDIIIHSGLASTASAVDRVAWDELVTGPVRRLLGAALQPCFLNCLDLLPLYAPEFG
jgi:capsid portal protein